MALPQQIDPGRLPSKVAAELRLIWPRVAVPKLIGPTETQASSWHQLGQHRAAGPGTRHLHAGVLRALGLLLMQCATPVPPVQWPGGESGGMIYSATHFFPAAPYLQAQKASTSSAMFYPIAAPHHVTNNIHPNYSSYASSGLGLSRGLHTVCHCIWGFKILHDGLCFEAPCVEPVSPYTAAHHGCSSLLQGS